jgi:hypothetical protein
MKKFAALLLCTGFIINVSAQSVVSGGIRGKVLDTTGKQSLADATLSIIGAKDFIAVCSETVEYRAACRQEWVVEEGEGIKAG